MTVDWPNEEYVRVYTRETADDLDLPWQALALWRALLLRFDRSGIIAARNGWLSVSRMTRIPLEVVEAAGPELLRDGRMRQVDGGFWAPNFIDAQTASKSDKVRQKESRDRRRAEVAAKTVNQVIDIPSAEITNSHEPSHAVTPESHAVTSGHAPSQNVTLCSALLCDASPGSALLPVTPAAPENLQGPTQGAFDRLAQKVDDSVRHRDRAPREKLKHKLPDGWTPSRTDANREAEAVAVARGVDIGNELKRLRDWAVSNNEKKADWDATWRNWTRNAKPTHGARSNQTALDAQFARVEMLRAQERDEGESE